MSRKHEWWATHLLCRSRIRYIRYLIAVHIVLCQARSNQKESSHSHVKHSNRYLGNIQKLKLSVLIWNRMMAAFTSCRYYLNKWTTKIIQNKIQKLKTFPIMKCSISIVIIIKSESICEIIFSVFSAFDQSIVLIELLVISYMEFCNRFIIIF